MKSSRTITLAIGLASSALILTLGWRKNCRLTNQVDGERQAIAQLKAELGSAAPPTELWGEPVYNGNRVARRETHSSITGEARFERSLKQLDILLQDGGSNSQTYEVLPELLRIIKGLDSDQIIALTREIEAGEWFGEEDTGSFSKAFLLSLVAGQDPLKILSQSDLVSTWNVKKVALAALAKEDLAAAREWMEIEGVKDSERAAIESIHLAHLLQSDPMAGLEFIKEQSTDGNPIAERLHFFTDELVLPEESIARLLAGYESEGDANVRDQISEIVLGAATMSGGVERAKEVIGQMQLSQEQLVDHFDHAFFGGMLAEPEAALALMTETLEDRAQLEAIPTAISDWADEDLNAAGAYLAEMEASQLRDRSVHSFAAIVAEVDPQAASIWISEIKNPMVRSQAIAEVAEIWSEKDRSAAAAWLELQPSAPATN